MLYWLSKFCQMNIHSYLFIYLNYLLDHKRGFFEEYLRCFLFFSGPMLIWFPILFLVVMTFKNREIEFQKFTQQLFYLF